MHISSFPYELLENIATQLSTREQYIGLTICKSWYSPFCRALYRHIKIKTRKQLKQYITLQQNGHLVRTIQIGLSGHMFKPEDGVTGAIPPLSPVQVGVTLHEFIELMQNLPLVQAVQFDHRLWQFMDINKVHFSNRYLISVPILDHPRQLRLLNQQLQKLHLRGSDIFNLHQQNRDTFFDMFQGLHNLSELTIDGDAMWDVNHIMKFDYSDMNKLHEYLPSLQKLKISDAVHFLNDYKQSYGVPTKLKKFQISALVDQEAMDSWLSYFSLKYPLLTCLDINFLPSLPLTCNKKGLTLLLTRLPQLQAIKIHHKMSKLMLEDDSIKTINNLQHLKQLEIGLWGNNGSNTEALKCINKPRVLVALTRLSIPNWNSSMDLSSFHKLVKLELSVPVRHLLQRVNKDMAIQEGRQGVEGNYVYNINTILDICPSLSHLELNGGKSSNNISSFGNQHDRLKTLRMDRVFIGDTNLFAQLSMRCPNLEGLFLQKCHGVKEIIMCNQNFKYIVLSDMKQPGKDTVDLLKVIEFKKLDKQRKRRAKFSSTRKLYKSYQDKYTFHKNTRRITYIDQYQPFISISCYSVDQLIFNGCKI